MKTEIKLKLEFHVTVARGVSSVAANMSNPESWSVMVVTPRMSGGDGTTGYRGDDTPMFTNKYF